MAAHYDDVQQSLSTILIATTHNDLSLSYFLDERVTCIYFDDPLGAFQAGLSARDYQVVYIRDPFNNHHNKFDDVEHRTKLIYAAQSASTFIDHANTFEKILFEDKWDQYKVMRQVMPTTVIAQPDYFINGKHIAKKRISSRSRDIVFSASDAPIQDDWIIQEVIPIEEELRVYVVNGVILREASVKTSKTAEKKTKVVGVRPLTQEEYDFVAVLLAKVAWADLVGFDIAVFREGLSLIEVNRAPQFNKYNELVGRNIVAAFFDHVYKEREKNKHIDFLDKK